MEIPAARWQEALLRRRSRRLYEEKPISGEALEMLRKVCNEFRPFGAARAILTEHSEGVFKGVIGAYGKIRGAPFFFAFIGDMRDRYVREKVGYTGEGIVLEATALGLATCWVGRSFDQRIASSFVAIKEHEKILAVAAVGYAREESSFEEKVLTGFGTAHRRKDLAELVRGRQETVWPEWIRESLLAARLAPSAVNRQPWRFLVQSDSITISLNNLRDTYGISKRLDCGVAMLHLETAALFYGVRGGWEFLDPPQVARFTAHVFAG